MAITKKKIELLARALFPRHGLHDVASLVATIVKYRNNDGYVTIGRPDGRWSWHAARASTAVTPSRVVLAFRSDYRRNASQAREDLYRQLEDAALSVMSEDEVDAAIARAAGKKVPITASPATPEKRKTPAAQLDREIAEVLAAPKLNLGKERAKHLAAALRRLGHEAEAFRQYGQWEAVGVDRLGPHTAGTWRHIVAFTDAGDLVPPAGGRHHGTGNPWRYGPEHDAVEEAVAWQP